MQAVNVPGVGTLQFPDGMSQQDMAAAIYKNFPKLRPQQQAAPPQQAPTQSIPEDLDPQATEAEEQQLKQLPVLGAGLSEGAKRFWGGLKQLGGDFSDAWNTYINPTVNPQTGEGNTPTAGAEATAAENARREAASQEALKRFGPGGQFGQNLVAGMTETGLDVAPAMATEGALGPTTTLTGNAARQAGLASLQALTAFSPTNDKSRDVALAGGTAGVAGLLNPVSVWSAAWNHVRKAFLTYGGRSEAAYQAARPIMGWGTEQAAANNEEPTLAMRAGLPTTRTLEAAGFNGKLQERYQAVRDAFLRKFNDVFQLPQQSAESPALDSAYQTVLNSATGTLKGLRRQASDAYSSGMNEAIRLAQSNGSNSRMATVQVPELRSILNEIMGNQTEQLTERPDLALGPIAKLRAIITKQDGRLSVQDIAAKLRAWSQTTLNSGNPSEIAITNKARSALYNDIDAYVQKGGKAEPALSQVLATRAGYRQSMQNIEALQQTAAYRFLGVKSPTDVNPDNLVERFASFAPAKQRQVADFLRTNSPELLQLMRRKVVQDAANAATARINPASNSDVDVVGLLRQLYDDKSGVLKTSGLWNKSEQEQMERFRQAAKVVLNVSPHEASGAGMIIGPAEIAPNLVSLSPIFGARQLARGIFLGHGADIFTDPTIYNDIMRIRKTSGPAQTAARTILSQYLAKTYGASGEQ